MSEPETHIHDFSGEQGMVDGVPMLRCVTCDEAFPVKRPVLEHLPGTENFRTHPATQCEGHVCCIHNRSNHSMRSFPQYWRFDRELMERICPHGVGHPDPDHLAFVRLMRGDDAARTESIHGCDGCCK